MENVGQAKTLPEDLGELTALQLMTEITQSGTIGRYQLIMSLVFMTIGKEDIGRIKIHKSGIDENLIYALRDIKNIFGSEAFFTEDEEEPNFMILSIKGSGFTNISKKVA